MKNLRHECYRRGRSEKEVAPHSHQSKSGDQDRKKPVGFQHPSPNAPKNWASSPFFSEIIFFQQSSYIPRSSGRQGALVGAFGRADSLHQPTFSLATWGVSSLIRPHIAGWVTAVRFRCHDGAVSTTDLGEKKCARPGAGRVGAWATVSIPQFGTMNQRGRRRRNDPPRRIVPRQIPVIRPVESPSRSTSSTPMRSSMLRYRFVIGVDLKVT